MHDDIIVIAAEGNERVTSYSSRGPGESRIFCMWLLSIAHPVTLQLTFQQNLKREIQSLLNTMCTGLLGPMPNLQPGSCVCLAAVFVWAVTVQHQHLLCVNVVFVFKPEVWLAIPGI